MKLSAELKAFQTRLGYAFKTPELLSDLSHALVTCRNFPACPAKERATPAIRGGPIPIQRHRKEGGQLISIRRGRASSRLAMERRRRPSVSSAEVRAGSRLECRRTRSS